MNRFDSLQQYYHRFLLHQGLRTAECVARLLDRFYVSWTWNYIVDHARIALVTSSCTHEAFASETLFIKQAGLLQVMVAAQPLALTPLSSEWQLAHIRQANMLYRLVDTKSHPVGRTCVGSSLSAICTLLRNLHVQRLCVPFSTNELRQVGFVQPPNACLH